MSGAVQQTTFSVTRQENTDLPHPRLFVPQKRPTARRYVLYVGCDSIPGNPTAGPF